MTATTLPLTPEGQPHPCVDPAAPRSELTTDLLHRIEAARAAGDEAERRRLVDELVLVNLGVAHSVAMRYRGRGISADDLDQVARLALVRAAQGFDTRRQNDFLAYAVPTIRGEVRKHFRDQGWVIRPPRRIQELQSRIVSAAAELTQRLGRSPRPSEIARLLDVPIEEIEDALAAEGCFSPSSLDRPVQRHGSTSMLGDLIPDEHDLLDAADARVILAPAVRRLCDRDRRILKLRFFHGWTQEEIAGDIGVTQMHVSRLLTKILGALRDELGGGPPSRSA